jgi:large subunit ribosomal protein L4
MTKIKTWDGAKLGSATLDGESLGSLVKLKLLRETVRMYQANKRQGTVKTKSRGEITATTRKPYAQKGTGNARRGDFKSPLLRGGGVIFGPRPRNFGFNMPRKALREALRTALAGKLRDDEVASMKSAGFETPSTKKAAAALAGLGCEGSSVVVLAEVNDLLYRSFRNLKRVSVLPASDLNAYHVLSHDNVVLVDGAWDALMQRLDKTAEKVAPAAKPAKVGKPTRSKKLGKAATAPKAAKASKAPKAAKAAKATKPAKATKAAAKPAPAAESEPAAPTPDADGESS